MPIITETIKAVNHNVYLAVSQMYYSETHGCLQAISCLPFSAHFADIVAFKDAIGNILLVMKGTRIWSCLFKKYSMAGLISSSFFL